jgi:hypothetical protein
VISGADLSPTSGSGCNVRKRPRWLIRIACRGKPRAAAWTAWLTSASWLTMFRPRADDFFLKKFTEKIAWSFFCRRGAWKMRWKLVYYQQSTRCIRLNVKKCHLLEIVQLHWPAPERKRNIYCVRRKELVWSFELRSSYILFRFKLLLSLTFYVTFDHSFYLKY